MRTLGWFHRILDLVSEESNFGKTNPFLVRCCTYQLHTPHFTRSGTARTPLEHLKTNPFLFFSEQFRGRGPLSTKHSNVFGPAYVIFLAKVVPLHGALSTLSQFVSRCYLGVFTGEQLRICFALLFGRIQFVSRCYLGVFTLLFGRCYLGVASTPLRGGVIFSIQIYFVFLPYS